MAAYPLLGLVALLGLQSPAPDSAEVLRRARDAQARFEQFRRTHLPFTAPIAGRAEERIGRFRFWHDGDPTGHLPPAEPASVRAARERLLITLDTAATLAPRDPWIAGQLVRYLIEHGSPDRARSATHRCGAAAWWCHALEGLACHSAGDVPAAEAAFAAALRAMPEEHRCRWTDVSLLLEGAFRQRYRKLDCASRATLDTRLWWLARPLYLLPGNDRYTEHLARMTMVEIQRDARNAYGVRWGDDLEQITVRYGWPTAWSAESPLFGGMHEPVIVGHDGTPSLHFLPSPEALAEPYAARDDDWTLQAPPAPPQAPRERYAPAYADSFVALPHQLAAFQRGDSTIVVASYDLTRSLGFGDPPLEVALVLAEGPRGEIVLSRSDRASGQLVATAAPGALIVGLEALSRKARRAARVRYALRLPPATRVTVSDLLLLEPMETLPTALQGAIPHVLSSEDLGARRRVVVFWEAYGLALAGEPVEISLSVRRAGDGLLRRAARAVGLVGRTDPVRLAWHEAPRASGPVTGRALLLDLSSLGPGSYQIELSVDAAQQDPVIVSREIRLGEPPSERASRR